MALRIKSHWPDNGNDRSWDEIAGAIAFIAWRLAVDKAINLHGRDFQYDGDRQRIEVITEYLIFQIQIVDRIVVQNLELGNDARQTLIVTLAKKLGEHLQDNCQDLLGTGDYLAAFFEKLNERGGEYAEFSYGDDGPSYPFMRHLGYEIQQIMGSEGENRWVIDQVMDQDGVEVNRELKRALYNLAT